MNKLGDLGGSGDNVIESETVGSKENDEEVCWVIFAE